MKKLNLYDIDVLLLRLTPTGANRYEKHVLYVAARNVKSAFVKASGRIDESPHGVPARFWKLTGNYRLMGKIFI